MTEDFSQDALALQTVVSEWRVLVAGHGCSTMADFCLVIYLQTTTLVLISAMLPSRNR